MRSDTADHIINVSVEFGLKTSVTYITPFCSDGSLIARNVADQVLSRLTFDTKPILKKRRLGHNLDRADVTVVVSVWPDPWECNELVFFQHRAHTPFFTPQRVTTNCMLCVA